MQLAIKNKWVSLGGASTVKDMDGNDVLKVKGKMFSFRKQKFLTTMADEPLYTVRNKLLSLFGRTAFVLDPSGKTVATVRRKLLSLSSKFQVESSIGKVEITGNILGFDYHIFVDGKEVGHIERKISLRDSFVLNIDDSFDYRLFVAFVIAIDNVTDRNK
ncbi:MAG: LURP-one-related family protein [Kiritimatiellae bacterium]|nr:LURP-one-related family protein [Kiritimatiellia bacterium]